MTLFSIQICYAWSIIAPNGSSLGSCLLASRLGMSDFGLLVLSSACTLKVPLRAWITHHSKFSCLNSFVCSLFAWKKKAWVPFSNVGSGPWRWISAGWLLLVSGQPWSGLRWESLMGTSWYTIYPCDIAGSRNLDAGAVVLLDSQGLDEPKLPQWSFLSISCSEWLPCGGCCEVTAGLES